MSRIDIKTDKLFHKETYMKALLLTLVISLTGSFALASEPCKLTGGSFNSNQTGAYIRPVKIHATPQSAPAIRVGQTR